MPTEQTSLYDQAYAQYMAHAHDPVFRLAMEIYLGETFQEMAHYHQGQIQAIVDKLMHQELAQVRKSLTKHYLATRLEEIQKATKKDQRRWDKEGYWVREHGRFARYVGPKSQNVEGGPRTYSRNVDDPKEFLRQQFRRDFPEGVPHDEDERRRRAMGLKMHHGVELPEGNFADHARDVWQRTADMHNDLFARTNDPRDKQRIQYVIQSPDGQKRIEIPKAGNLPDVDYTGGERVHFMTPVGPDNPVHAGGQAINIGMIAGMSPEQAAKVGGVTQGLNNILNETTWGKKMSATASTIAALSGGSPAAVQAAAFAHMVNIIGPQASRAFGGKLRQLTYRYTGQEHAPEDWPEVAQKGRVGGESTRALEMKLINDMVVHEHALPTRSEYLTSLKLGSTTPSHGFILDKDGKVVSMATGYSDDWYTPFNLKKLPQMRGGSYVRSRAYGGLTPEDIRMAMRTGATRATVVSNNGVFTMEFNPKALHWGHRWGFAGGGMVRRYTKALDAIKNKEIDDPNVVGADKALKLNAQGYRAAMQDLRMKFPTWVVDPRKGEGVKDPNSDLRTWHEPLSRFGLNAPDLENQGDRPDEDGYIAPLNTRAHGARWGWAEPGVGEMSLWEDPKSGKHAYHTMDRYRLQEDLLNNIRRTGQRQATPQPQPTRPANGGARPATPATARPMGNEVAGTVVSQPTAYTSREGQVARADVDEMLRQTKRLVMQAHSQGLPFESDSSDANEIVEMLQSSSNFTAHPDYKRLRDKLANDSRFREAFVDELGDQYLAHETTGKATGARQLLVDWETLGAAGRDEDEEPEVSDEEAGAQARAEEEARTFRGNENLPLDLIDQSPAVRAWAERSEDNMNAVRLWATHRMRMEEDPSYKPWRNPEIGQQFRQVNATLANILSNESRQAAERSAGVEPVRDTGETTTASAPTSFVPARLKQDAQGNPETAARALYAAITAGRSPEDAGVEVAQTIDTLKAHGRRSNDAFFSRTGAHMEDLFAEGLKRGSGRDTTPSDEEIDNFGREHGLNWD